MIDRQKCFDIAAAVLPRQGGFSRARGAPNIKRALGDCQKGCAGEVGVMSARVDSVAKRICERGRWKVNNLQLQKVLYILQMIHMGRRSQEILFNANFEAWDYGPVVPTIYRGVRMFGSRPVEDVFFGARSFREGSPKAAFIDEIADVLLPMKTSELVEITHWKDGAWAKHYEPGVRGIGIPDRDIAQEYHDRIRAGNR